MRNPTTILYVLDYYTHNCFTLNQKKLYVKYRLYHVRGRSIQIWGRLSIWTFMFACVAGQDCPQAPDFDDEDERHADHLQHEPRRLLLDHRLPHQLKINGKGPTEV